MAKIKSLASSPGTRQWQRWKENSQFSRSLFHAGKKINPVLLGQEVPLSSALAPGCLPSAVPQPLRPSRATQRHLLALKARREILLLDLRS